MHHVKMGRKEMNLALIEQPFLARASMPSWRVAQIQCLDLPTPFPNKYSNVHYVKNSGGAA